MKFILEYRKPFVNLDTSLQCGYGILAINSFLNASPICTFLFSILNMLITCIILIVIFKLVLLSMHSLIGYTFNNCVM